MRHLGEIILITSVVIAFLILNYAVYESSEQIRNYKREVFGMREDYKKLKENYENLQTKIKNFRKVNILNSNSESKNALIATIVEKYAKKVDGDVSIYYKNLTTGEAVTVDPERSYYMASLYKVILTIYLLEEVKEGHLKLTDAFGSPKISLEEALDKIITESNNEYAVALAQEYGWENIEEVMKEKLDIEFTFDEKLETNAENVGSLFEEIALSLKITDVESEYLLRLLNEQQYTQKLPKYLPKNTISHNKTGELDSYSHDAAIFYTPKANYVLVFMSSTAAPAATNEQMALMSKEIYETLNN